MVGIKHACGDNMIIRSLSGKTIYQSAQRTTRGALEEGVVEGIDFSGGDFRHAKLSSGSFDGLTAKGASFRGADLDGADIGLAELAGADLRCADLKPWSAALQKNKLPLRNDCRYAIYSAYIHIWQMDTEKKSGQ